MARIKTERTITEQDGVAGVFITRDEYREYVELQQKRDRSEGSLRTQMRIQEQEKINFAREVIRFIKVAGLKNLTEVQRKSSEYGRVEARRGKDKR